MKPILKCSIKSLMTLYILIFQLILLPPQTHFWQWKTNSSAEGIFQIYWSRAHDLQQLSYHKIRYETLKLGLLHNFFWEVFPVHFLENSFSQEGGLSINSGAVRSLIPVKLEDYKVLSFFNLRKKPASYPKTSKSSHHTQWGWAK